MMEPVPHDRALILAMDTTQEHGSLALARGGQLIECHAVHAPQSFASVLFEEITALLSRHGATLPQVELFAVASGPGSFTGVRVGLSAVKGFAASLGRPVATVSNLAATAAVTAGDAGVRVPVLDARRGEVYAGVYAADGRALADEIVAAAETLDRWLAAMHVADDAVLCGPDVERLPLPAMPRVTTSRTLAGAVAAIGWRMWRGGAATDALGADANYVRRQDTGLYPRR